MVPHAAVAFSEATPYFLPVLRDAILRRGMPRRLFVDNGANYTSKQLKLVCVKLKIHLVHGRVAIRRKGQDRKVPQDRQVGLSQSSRPGHRCQYPGPGQEVQDLGGAGYHNTPHRGIGHLTPLEKWASCADNIGEVPPASEFFDLFMFEEKRRVDKARTVSLKGHLYEVDASLCGEYVVLRFDPLAPPQRSLKVLHKGKDAGEATYLDERSNARIKRVPIKPVLKFTLPLKTQRRRADVSETLRLKTYPFDGHLHADELFACEPFLEAETRIRHLLDLRGIGLLTGRSRQRQDDPLPKAVRQPERRPLPGRLYLDVNRQRH